jgi:leucyl aminopeptidase (aminopeptidase T)
MTSASGNSLTERLESCALAALSQCLNLGRHERLLVVCDPPCEEIGRAFFDAGRQRSREAVMVEITPRKEDGNEPPGPVGEWFGQFDVAVMPTSKSLTHTQARRTASEKGCRIATLPGITREVFLRTMQVDWNRLGVATRRVAAHLSAARTIRIETPLGTNLTFETGGRHAKADDGRLNFKGAFGNLPAGEAYLAPLEGSAEGTVVVDGSFALAGLLDDPLVLQVKEGGVTDVSGHACAKEIEQLFVKYHRDARNIAEFGVGTLDGALVSGNTLEDEKAKGTVHVALGDNASMGGTVRVPVHLDAIMRSPSVWLDDKLWMDRGELVGQR